MQTNLTLGALPLPDGAYQFRVWAPFFESISLELFKPGLPAQSILMEPEPEGYFSVRVPSVAQESCYFYRCNDKQKLPDPASRYQPQGVDGPSAVVADNFNWTDKNWRGRALKDYIIYELHVGTYTKEGTFTGVIPYLDRLCELGITAVELMPIAQFSGERNWGYDGVLPFAVQNSYGGPEGLKQLVNACHERNLAVVLDVVYNHLGPEGNIFHQFGPYFTDFYRTPWGSAINFDGAFNHHVRRYFIENALHWFKEYHIDALRLDALHAIYDASAKPFLRELADHTHALSATTDRKLYLIAESDLNDTRLLLPEAKGGFGLDAQWSDDFHHALHTLLTKELNGYYEDFGALSHLIKAYEEGYVYSGQYSVHRKRPHGCSSQAIPASQLVVFSQNHDQIGNRLKGDRLSASLSSQQLKLAAGLVILSPYIPLLFMGEEYAETAPFYFFTSFSNPELIKAVREGRQKEFAGFSWNEPIPDPQALATFQDSTLNHDLIQQPQHIALFNYYKQLIALRKSNPALSNLNKQEMKLEVDRENQVVAVYRYHEDHKILMLFHFNPDTTNIDAPTPAGAWTKLLDSSDEAWGGSGSQAPETISTTNTITLSLPPFAFVVYGNKT